ncbi:alpha/beta hydrolase [Pleionea sp. CnH1-48]|uniref:alpha/beta hydrolase n=1 Tax=Pleionea sp. CnH1-48 TaxID=2954494 RepID=UPI002096DE5E|nr:alpha/beta hydrolase [Pleionea sp. CnH1-48]MCO7226483.1 alpha/beta hydrolase [Pleionea sp. CnH1-48]
MNIAFTAYRISNQIKSMFAPSSAAKSALNRFIRPRRFTPKAWEHKAEASGTRIAISSKISAIRWRSSSSEDSKIPNKKLLLVHGWESRATQMYGLVPALLNKGYEVIAIDMPAHGHSHGNISHAEAFIQTILLTQQHFGEFDAIVGHSLGAAASSIALSRGLNTQKLVLISGPSNIANVLTRFSQYVGLNNKATQHFLTHAGNLVGKQPSDLDAINVTDDILVNTLVIHDQNDVEVPMSESQRLMDKFKNAELFITQGLGHRQILKSEEVIDRVSAFL